MLQSMPVPAKKKLIVLMPKKASSAPLSCVVGIFAHRGLPSELHPFGSQTLFFADLLRHARQRGIFMFVFGPDDFDDRVGDQWYGWILNSHDEWVREIVPQPDVIYDRILFLSMSLSRRAHAVRSVLHAEHFVFMNDPQFAKLSGDKWAFFLFTQKAVAVKLFLPETLLLQFGDRNFFKNHADFFTRYTEFVLKPRFGHKAKGVVRFRFVENTYSYDYTVLQDGLSHIYKGTLSSLEEIPQLLIDLPPYKDYVLQPLIYGARFHEKFFDVRMVFQRRHSADSWRTTFMAARVAPSNSLATNLSVGGTPFFLEEILQECFQESLDTPSGIAVRLQTLGEILCTVVGQHFFINEFAADVMIDENRAVWLLEINAKPDCGILRLLKADALLTTLLNNICSYARSLKEA